MCLHANGGERTNWGGLTDWQQLRACRNRPLPSYSVGRANRARPTIRISVTAGAVALAGRRAVGAGCPPWVLIPWAVPGGLDQALLAADSPNSQYAARGDRDGRAIDKLTCSWYNIHGSAPIPLLLTLHFARLGCLFGFMVGALS